MKIQPIVVGTAGHIDHGKSTLVKTLTGIDPDRLKEEQERGMTIDLGFARFQLPDGRTVGIVDVPGHERFVKNMVAGATGIDLVILVVAADDGVMPQTREHLSIMSLLGIERGLIALTKIDMVDPELVQLAADDVRAAVAGTFLEKAPIFPLSSLRGDGLEAFRKALYQLASQTPARSAQGVFRMPIQRVFSAKGFGTVVTGIPMSGEIRVGDTLEILPHGLVGKVRGLQAYSQGTDSARAGHSCAVNLSDVDHKSVTRGDVLAAPGYYRGVRMLGAQLSALPGLARPIRDRTEVRLHLGTAEHIGELVLLDKQELAPGETGLVQLRMEAPVVCAPGDRFIVRLASPTITLGGGVVLEESKHRLKRFKAFVVEELGRAAESVDTPREWLEVALSRAKDAVQTPEALSVEIKKTRADTERLLNDLKAQGKVRHLGLSRWIHAERLEQDLERARAEFARWFDEQEHRELMDVRDLRTRTRLDAAYLDLLLAEGEARGLWTAQPGGMVRKSGPRQLDPRLQALSTDALARLTAARFQTPSPAELALAMGLPERTLAPVLELLVDRGELVRITREFVLPTALHEEARAAIVANCQKHGSLDIPALRDQLCTTRKWIIPLLEHFDAAGLTLRQGANRVLRRR